MKIGTRGTSTLPIPALMASGGVLLLLVAATILYTLRVRDDLIEHTGHDLDHLALVMAESAARALETADVVLDIAGDTLSRSRWHDWTPEQGVAFLKTYRTRHNIPQLRDILLFDAEGGQRFLTSIWPVPHINVADRPYFQAHRDGRESYRFGPYIGRNTGTATFAITRRVNDGDGRFDGVLMASMEPGYFSRICATGRPPPQTDAALVNTEGLVVAACSEGDAATRPADQVLAGGRLAGRLPLSAGLHRVGGYLVRVAELERRPELKVVAVASLETRLGAWLTSSMVQWTIGALALLTLLTTGLALRARHSHLASRSAHLESAVRQKSAEADEARGVAESAIETERQTLREQRNFLGMISHEFRVPLAIIDSAAQLLSMLGADRPEAEEEMSKIRRAVQRMTALMDSYLSEDRLSTCGLPFRPAPMDLHELLGMVCRSQARLGGGRSIQFSSAGTLMIQGDPDLLRIMFDNLIGNALKFSPADRPVLVAMWRRNDEAEVVISDSGAGIPAEDHEHVFEKYFRSSHATTVQGAGLGLFIVRSVADLHGGEIVLDSEVGRGTTFTVILPIRESGLRRAVAAEAQP
jgi:signal transduction histidine kinase